MRAAKHPTAPAASSTLAQLAVGNTFRPMADATTAAQGRPWALAPEPWHSIIAQSETIAQSPRGPPPHSRRVTSYTIHARCAPPAAGAPTMAVPDSSLQQPPRPPLAVLRPSEASPAAALGTHAACFAVARCCTSPLLVGMPRCVCSAAACGGRRAGSRRPGRVASRMRLWWASPLGRRAIARGGEGRLRGYAQSCSSRISASVISFTVQSDVGVATQSSA